MKKALVLVAIPLLLLAGVGFFLWKSFDVGKKTPPPPGSWAVEASLSSDSATFLVDLAGGSFDLAVGDLDGAAVTFAPDSSFGASVTAKQITSLSNLPAGAKFVSGVSFGPDGEWFAKHAILELPLPADASDSLYAFRYEGTGEKFQLYPLRTNGDKAVIPITGFSGYGLLHLEVDAKEMPVPTGIGAAAKQDIAMILGADLFRDEVSAELASSIQEILIDWYHREVESNVKAALTQDSLAIDALKNWLDWSGTAQALGIDSFTQMDDAAALAKQVLDNALAKTAERCEDTRDPAEGVRLVQLASIAELLGFAADGDYEAAISAAAACLQFELEIESTMSDESGNISATGTSVLMTDPDTFQLSGEGMIQEETNFIFGGSVCTVEPNPAYGFTILPIDLSTAVGISGQSSLELVFVIGDNPDATWLCVGEEVDSTFVGPYNRWQELFIDAHEDEEIPLSIANDVLNFLIADWDFSSTDEGVIATKTYDRTIGSIAEKTVFTLKRAGK